MSALFGKQIDLNIIFLSVANYLACSAFGNALNRGSFKIASLPFKTFQCKKHISQFRQSIKLTKIIRKK